MHATLIYPHQLFLPAIHPALDRSRPVYLAEEPLFLTEFPTHASKLLLHRLTLKAYETTLTEAGYTVRYLDVREYGTSNAIIELLVADGVTTIHVVDTTDDWLEGRLSAVTTRHQLTLVCYESPLFILPAAEACTRYQKSKRQMARFYRSLREDHRILMETDGTPVGGRFSFDTENRRRLPRAYPLPPDLTPEPENVAITAARAWLADLPAHHVIGDATCWLPTTHAEAEAYLTDFLTTRLAEFGPFEDAITTTATRVFHSALSPLINIGLLTPTDVLKKTLAWAATHPVPLPSLEGFVRQLLGWREFIRAAYLTDGRTMRTRNFFHHTRPLPTGSWDATTGITPLDHTIQTALRYGYTHHIERLMVAGNLFLLSGTHPDEVYRWFMALYVDAYDWVMVPNVYGMSQFADGGLFATKPYIAGASYIKKMSDHPPGPWEDIVTGLYWRFIGEHRDLFLKNHRLSMMPKLLDRLAPERRTALRAAAETFLARTPSA